MRRNSPLTALTAFTLFLFVGIATYYLLGYQGKVARQHQGDLSQTRLSSPDEFMPASPVAFGPISQLTGYASTKTIKLRESPNASAPVIATLKMSDYESLEILGATRDFIRVKIPASKGLYEGGTRTRDYEGWAAWGQVVPQVTAIVLDADTGAAVSHIPLNISGAIAYSPDGSRAIFYSPYRVLEVAYEISAKDYTLTRSLSFPGERTFGSVFYSPSDGALYAAILTPYKPFDAYTTRDAKLSIVRVSNTGESKVVKELSSAATGFVISPDGRTGFITHLANPVARTVSVDVVDLETFGTRGVLTIEGDNLPEWPYDIATSNDGSELYLNVSGSSNNNYIKVWDTRTGRWLRDIKASSNKDAQVYVSQDNVVGDSLFFNVWSRHGAHWSSRGKWIDSSGAITSAQRGIAFVVEAGGARFAIDEEGTRFFKLDANNRIRKRLPIDRPDIRGPHSDIGVYGLTASPDGKRIILFVGPMDGC